MFLKRRNTEYTCTRTHTHRRRKKMLSSEEKKCIYMSACAFLCLSTTIVTIVCLATSIRSIDENDVAVAFERLTMKYWDDGATFEGGRHLFAPQTRLFVFPRNIRSMEKTLECVTGDGLTATLVVSLQYRFQLESLVDVVRYLGGAGAAEEVVSKGFESAIYDACSSIAIIDFSFHDKYKE